MAKLIRVLLAAALIIISGCATYPTDDLGQAKYHIEKAKSAQSSGNAGIMRGEVYQALSKQSGPALVKAYFAQDPGAATYFVRETDAAIPRIKYTDDAVQEAELLILIGSTGVLPEATSKALLHKLDHHAAESNESGAIPFMLNHKLSNFPFSTENRHREIILRRTIKSTIEAQGSHQRQVQGLMEYAADPRVPQEQRRIIEDSLPSLNIRRSELPHVSPVFPDFAAKHAPSLTARATLNIQGADRIFEDDLKKTLLNVVRGVEWVDTGIGGVTEVTIEKVRHNEREAQPQRETVTYAQHQVNLFSAALLMPRNASYMYDISTSGSEIEYGYIVSAKWPGGGKHEEIVRGDARSQRVECSNARIQNVFGGTSSAGFVANSDMEQRCRGGVAGSMADLRKQVNELIAKAVARVPPIQKAHSLN